jgi:hypothetical protein
LGPLTGGEERGFQGDQPGQVIEKIQKKESNIPILGKPKTADLVAIFLDCFLGRFCKGGRRR